MPQTIHSCVLLEKYINQPFWLHCIYLCAKFGTKHGHWYILMMDCEGMKWKRKKHHTVGTVPKSNRKLVETEAKPIPLTHIHDLINTHIHDLSNTHIHDLTNTHIHDLTNTHIHNLSNTHIHDLSVSWLGTDTTMKSGRAKLLLCTFYSNV